MTAKSPLLIKQGTNVPLVWYASYGSNMDAKRFYCYITGGTPIGGTRNYIGCDDKNLPRADTAIELPYQLYFAGESKVWTGGLAFLGHESSDGKTLGRAYLLTVKQFEQVAAQESWRDKALQLDIDTLRKLGRAIMGDGSGNYDEMIYCGEQEGHPVISFTSPKEKRPFTKPAEVYVKLLSSGLKSAHNLTPLEVAIYLHDKPGIAGAYAFDELLDLVE